MRRANELALIKRSAAGWLRGLSQQRLRVNQLSQVPLWAWGIPVLLGGGLLVLGRTRSVGARGHPADAAAAPMVTIRELPRRHVAPRPAALPQGPAAPVVTAPIAAYRYAPPVPVSSRPAPSSSRTAPRARLPRRHRRTPSRPAPSFAGTEARAVSPPADRHPTAPAAGPAPRGEHLQPAPLTADRLPMPFVIRLYRSGGWEEHASTHRSRRHHHHHWHWRL